MAPSRARTCAGRGGRCWLPRTVGKVQRPPKRLPRRSAAGESGRLADWPQVSALSQALASTHWPPSRKPQAAAEHPPTPSQRALTPPATRLAWSGLGDRQPQPADPSARPAIYQARTAILAAASERAPVHPDRLARWRSDWALMSDGHFEQKCCGCSAGAISCTSTLRALNSTRSLPLSTPSRPLANYL